MRRHGRHARDDGALQCLPVPIHENGILGAPMVGDQRFHGGGGRPVFGLWAAYSVAASRPIKDSASACAVQHFVPITAAGQRWIFTSFPFNKPP